MGETSSEHRLAENEAMFRRINEQVQAGFDETNRLADEDNQPEFRVGNVKETEILQFFCECADENCAKRIPVSLREYQKVHKNRRRFIIAHGHEVTSVERIISVENAYTVVEKNVFPPQEPETMHPTSIDNT